MVAAVIAALLAAVTIAPPGHADEAAWSPTFEHQVKIGFLYNFAKFVEWPPEAFRGPAAPLVISILGSDPLCDALGRALQGKTVNARPIALRRLRRVDPADPGQILFIGSSVGREAGAILATLRTVPVLTVGDMKEFAALGGIINFTIEDHKVRFEINLDAAERAGLRVSSQLLTVGRIVREPNRTGGH